MKSLHSEIKLIEPLEDRIAPATLVSPYAVTYQDTDGDNVTVNISKALFTTANVNNALNFDVGATNGTAAAPDNGTKQQLTRLDLTWLGTPATVSGLNVSVSATKSLVNGGDGLAKVGFVDGLGLDLGNVTIGGALGGIDSGSGAATKGLTSLTVDSLGGGNQSVINGQLGSLIVKHDVINASLDATKGLSSVHIYGDLVGVGQGMGKISSDAAMGNVTIDGSVIGYGDFAGLIQSNGPMGTVTIGKGLSSDTGQYSGAIFSPSTIAGVSIGGDLWGSDGAHSGSIEAGGAIGAVSIGGVVHGGSGASSGFVHSTGALASVTVGSSVVGGSGIESGKIRSDAAMGNVTIHGSLMGGSGNYTGLIQDNGAMGTVTIGGDVVGGSGVSSGEVYTPGKLAGVSIGGSLIGGTKSNSGSIQAVGDIGAVHIGKDMIGSTAFAVGNTAYIQGDSIASVSVGGKISAKTGHNGSIVAAHSLGPVTITGDVTGSGLISDPVVISAGGALHPTAYSDLAIASLTIGGNLTHANILAGYGPVNHSGITTIDPVDGDAGIGAVLVKGNWTASSLVAGVKDTGPGGSAVGDGFGQHDTAIGGGTSLVAKIASVTINGTATGKAGGGFYGITAEAIGSLRIGATTYPLTAALDNLLLDHVNNNFRLVEV